MTRISLVHSTICAFKGMFQGIVEERNIKIQILFTALVISALITLRISQVYILISIISLSLVIILELLNTNVERLIDVISPDYNKELGKIKDIMAGIVLFAVFVEIIVNFIILFRPGINFLFQVSRNWIVYLGLIANVFLLVIILLVVLIKKN